MFATYFGGNGSQTAASAICVDTDGNIFLAGTTSRNNSNQPDTFPVTSGAAFTDPSKAGSFVAKLHATATEVDYATFLPLFPTSNSTLPGHRPLSMAIDPTGNAYITGSTGGPQFPTTPFAFQSGPQNPYGAGIVAKLSADGSALVYATYLSGNDIEFLQGIALDSAGNAYVTGYTASPNFPVTPGAYETSFPTGRYPGFATKLNPQGTGLVYSTFFGSSANASGGQWEIKVDSQGGAYVLGTGAPAVPFGGYLSHLSPDGSALLYSNFVLTPSGLDVDAAGNAFVDGIVGSGVLAATPGAFQTSLSQGGSDAFAAKFTPDGQLAGATFAGGLQTGTSPVIAAAPNGSIVLAASTFVTSIFPALTLQNAASLTADPIAPGEIVAIRGYGLGPRTGVVPSGGDLPLQLDGVEVSFDGIMAPLFYAQDQQINAQVPWEIEGRTSSFVRVSYDAPGMSTTISTAPVAVRPASPGVFYIIIPTLLKTHLQIPPSRVTSSAFTEPEEGRQTFRE